MPVLGPPCCARSQLTAGAEIQGVWSAPPPKLKYRGGQKACTVLKGSRRMENISYPRGPPQKGVRSSSLEGPITKRTALPACFVRESSARSFPSIPLPPANCSRGTCPRKSQLHQTRAQSPPPFSSVGFQGTKKKIIAASKLRADLNSKQLSPARHVQLLKCLWCSARGAKCQRCSIPAAGTARGPAQDEPLQPKALLRGLSCADNSCVQPRAAQGFASPRALSCHAYTLLLCPAQLSPHTPTPLPSHSTA